MLVFKYCKINQDEVQNMTVMKHLPAWPVFWPPQQRELSQPPLASVEAGASIEVPGPSIEVPGPPVEGITVTMQPGKASLSLCYSPTNQTLSQVWKYTELREVVFHFITLFYLFIEVQGAPRPSF